MRKRALTAALAACLTIAPVAAANAAPAHHGRITHSILRGWCDEVTAQKWCIASFDDGYLHAENGRGHRVVIGDEENNARGERLIWRYIKGHAKPCAQEDSDVCYWDAGHQGNGVGESYIVIGRGRHADVVYL